MWFLSSCLYSALNLTCVREQRFIRMVHYFYYLSLYIKMAEENGVHLLRQVKGYRVMYKLWTHKYVTIFYKRH